MQLHDTPLRKDMPSSPLQEKKTHGRKSRERWEIFRGTSRRLSCVCCLLALSIASVGRADANVLSNGDFETGDLTSWTWTPDLGSEPLMTPTVVSYEGSLSFRVNPGNEVGAGGPESGGMLSQMVPVENETTYLLSVETLAIAEVDFFQAGNADGGTISVSLGGELLHTFDVEAIGGAKIITDSFSATYDAVATGNVPLEIYFSRKFDNSQPNIYHYVDGITLTAQPTPGDMNGDGFFNTLDINLFVKALTNRDAYEQDFPFFLVDMVGDVNNDGSFNLGDVAPFKTLLAPPASLSSTAVPEPTGFLLLLVGLGLLGVNGECRLIRRRRA